MSVSILVLRKTFDLIFVCVYKLLNCNEFVSVGLKKKLQSLGKIRGCEPIKPWVSSIVNHLYWSVTSSDGDADLTLAKWKSVMCHIQNIHDCFGDPFPACVHCPLVGRELRKTWIKPCK